MPTGFFSTIFVGALIGWLASIIAKTNNQMGCLWNIAIGIVGAGLGNWLASRIFGFGQFQHGFSLSGFLVGIAGAVVLIFLLRAIGMFRRE